MVSFISALYQIHVPKSPDPVEFESGVCAGDLFPQNAHTYLAW